MHHHYKHAGYVYAHKIPCAGENCFEATRNPGPDGWCGPYLDGMWLCGECGANPSYHPKIFGGSKPDPLPKGCTCERLHDGVVFIQCVSIKRGCPVHDKPKETLWAKLHGGLVAWWNMR